MHFSKSGEISKRRPSTATALPRQAWMPSGYNDAEIISVGLARDRLGLSFSVVLVSTGHPRGGGRRHAFRGHRQVTAVVRCQEQPSVLWHWHWREWFDGFWADWGWQLEILERFSDLFEEASM
uniref:Uncharacterized protein n=1 Tax=Panagrellus redivivus TaxID=6233 RepID=A0A7E4VXB3_PANRE